MLVISEGAEELGRASQVLAPPKELVILSVFESLNLPFHSGFIVICVIYVATMSTQQVMDYTLEQCGCMSINDNVDWCMDQYCSKVVGFCPLSRAWFTGRQVNMADNCLFLWFLAVSCARQVPGYSGWFKQLLLAVAVYQPIVLQRQCRPLCQPPQSGFAWVLLRQVTAPSTSNQIIWSLVPFLFSRDLASLLCVWRLRELRGTQVN